MDLLEIILEQLMENAENSLSLTSQKSAFQPDVKRLKSLKLKDENEQEEK